LPILRHPVDKTRGPKANYLPLNGQQGSGLIEKYGKIKIFDVTAAAEGIKVAKISLLQKSSFSVAPCKWRPGRNFSKNFWESYFFTITTNISKNEKNR